MTRAIISTGAAANDGGGDTERDAWIKANANFLELYGLLAGGPFLPETDAHLLGVPTAPTAALGTNTAQIATMAAIKAAIDALVAGAPGALDTLNEIATQLASDESALSALITTVGGKQASAANLTAFSALAGAADKLGYFTGSGTMALTTLSGFIRTLLDDADAATARGTLGLVIGTDVQAYSAVIAGILGLTPANDDVLQRKGGVWVNRTIAQLKADLGVSSGADLQIFNASGTWTKPAAGTVTRVLIWGGGGGGGNGAVVAASTVVSGGGGGGGVYGFDRLFSTALLGATETVTVGAGGAAHTAGGTSSFGSQISSPGGGAGENGASGVGAGGGGSGGLWTTGNNASGTTGGPASGSGSAAGGAGGAGGTTSNFGSGGGGCLGSTFAGFGGAAGVIVPGGSSGGGAGGGISASNVAMAGAAGGGVRANSAGGPAGTIGGGNGGAQTVAVALNEGGGGGGGGGSATAANAGNGAAGQVPGGGGGGGGSTQTGFTAGTGAAGGAGRVIVITE